MAKLLYVRSKPGDDSRLILSERPPITLHLGAKLKAARLDLRSSKTVPKAGDFEWESFLYEAPSDPTGLRLILKRVSGTHSAQVAASCPSSPQQAGCCVPYTSDRANPGLRDSPVKQTENKTSTPNWDHWIHAFVGPKTLSNNKKNDKEDVKPWDRASCSSCKRAASETMNCFVFMNPSKRFFTES